MTSSNDAGAGPGNLAAFVDGAALPEDAARDLWKRFSEWMGEHKGDFAGFAKKTLPTLKEHKKLAEKLPGQSMAGKSAGG